MEIEPRPPGVTTMDRTALLERISSDPAICGGSPCIRGTRIEVQVILDSLAEGMSAEAIVDHFPSLQIEDVRAGAAYAAELARESVWRF